MDRTKTTDPNYRQTLEKALQGMTLFQNGELTDVSAYTSLPDGALLKMIDIAALGIDGNRKRRPGLSNTPAALTDDDQAKPKGQRENLITDLNAAENNGPSSLTPTQASEIEGALFAAGYNVSLDGRVDDYEMTFLQDFHKKLEEDPLITMKGVFDAVTQTNAALAIQADFAAKAAETKRLEQTNLQTQFAAGLLYAGVLNPQDAGDTKAVAAAMNRLLIENKNGLDIVAEQKKVFTDFDKWEPTGYGKELMARLTQGSMLPASFEADLESNDPNRVKLAQGYLALQGKDVPISGIVDQKTFEAGQAAIQAPLTIPDGLIGKNNKVNLDMFYSMVSTGQLYLPENKLSPEDQAIAQTFPLAKDKKPDDAFSREEFIGSQLLINDPDGYKQIIAAENERRAHATLDVTVAQPVVPVNPNANPIEERTVANNMLGLTAIDPTVVGGKTQTDIFNNTAIGKTDTFQTLVYSDAEKPLATFVDYMKGHSNGTVTMDDALRGLYYANTSEHTLLLQSMGGSDAPTGDVGMRINRVLGYDAKHEFNLNDPKELKDLLTGVASYANRQAVDMTKGQNYVEAFMNSQTSWMTTIESVATKETNAAAPAEEKKPVFEKGVPPDERGTPIASLSDEYKAAGLRTYDPAEAVPGVITPENRQVAGLHM